MGLLTSLRAKYDLYRLEQRYTKRTKRTTFVSGAQYVDGEYVYNSPATTGDSSRSAENKDRESDKSWGRGFGKRSSRVMVQEVFAGGKGLKGRRSSGIW